MSNDDRLIERLKGRLFSSQAEAKYPLFILGAGISFQRVPLLSEIGQWFTDELRSISCPAWLQECASRIAGRSATRRDAAEFFSVVQSNVKPMTTVWDKFSVAFLNTGFYVDSWKKKFHGISSQDVKPSFAHKQIAVGLRNAHAHVISLNFDGLTHRALTSRQPGVVLHSVQEIENYFCAETDTFVPAIIKIRGDVFYAICAEPYCPQTLRPYPLDRFRRDNAKNPLCCPSCGAKKLKLQFSFPGFRSKEEIANPMLSAARQFLGSRTSALILIGLSGRWDRYLLQFVFQFAKDRKLPIVDVKPPDADDLLINEFRSTYFPSISTIRTDSIADGACFYRIGKTADDFIKALGVVIS